MSKPGGYRNHATMAQVMYLGIEGVLFAHRPADFRPPRRQHQPPRVAPLPLLPAISRLLAGLPNVSVVINSRWVCDVGYRNLLSLLPDEIACTTVGATMPGNRSHRRSTTASRIDILRADIRRRCPARLAIVDASRYAVPYEYLAQAVHVTKAMGTREIAEIVDRIVQLLDADVAAIDEDSDFLA
ncbi:hypothetical protein J6349_18935 [Burkholderia pseudomallei]|nr:hypothetical protein [Burkholderia pseudomallei]MBO7918295.1 hypothetical protein [Burkholderia pseudomallei]